MGNDVRWIRVQNPIRGGANQSSSASDGFLRIMQGERHLFEWLRLAQVEIYGNVPQRYYGRPGASSRHGTRRQCGIVSAHFANVLWESNIDYAVDRVRR